MQIRETFFFFIHIPIWFYIKVCHAVAHNLDLNDTINVNSFMNFLDIYLRMTMSYTDCDNTSKQIQVSVTINIPQPLHMTLIYHHWLLVIGQQSWGQFVTSDLHGILVTNPLQIFGHTKLRYFQCFDLDAQFCIFKFKRQNAYYFYNLLRI